MKLTIKHQESYSRGELLLRSFFGFFYIALPHGILLWFTAIWASILLFAAWWVVLFTGRFPQSWFEFIVKFLNWQARVNASMSNLVDGYPAFFPSGTSDSVSLEVEYPEELDRVSVLLRTFFGIFYVMIPHGLCLYIRMIGTMFLMFIAWWVVLFTGEYPPDWHAFNVGTYRWQFRVNLYMMYMTDEYPPFSGKE
ncbi:MAG: DUF4389 domain-containing protein [Candidatus Aminicenantes bacterium]|nr:DUF4389 domain-containing protein [Candidatus Aminicenantes bacterium]